MSLEDDTIINNPQFNADLENFLTSGPAATPGTSTVNLQAPSSFEGATSPEVPMGKMDSTPAEGESSNSAKTAAAAAAAAAGAAAGALFGGKLGDANGLMAQAVGKAVENAVPSSLEPLKEKTRGFISKAQSWRAFFLPLSIPTAAEACTRLTGNMYVFQTNYAILFILNLMLTILWDNSALISIGITVVVWILFLRKNDDPDWHPEVSGMKLGPMQRFLALSAITAIMMLLLVGGAILHACFMFLLAAGCHGVAHDPSGYAVPGAAVHEPDPEKGLAADDAL